MVDLRVVDLRVVDLRVVDLRVRVRVEVMVYLRIVTLNVGPPGHGGGDGGSQSGGFQTRSPGGSQNHGGSQS